MRRTEGKKGNQNQTKNPFTLLSSTHSIECNTNIFSSAWSWKKKGALVKEERKIEMFTEGKNLWPLSFSIE
jgi:hypothetical protein